MTIYERQYNELLSRELLKVLVQGRLPNLRELIDHLSKSTENKGPLFEYVPQARRRVFNNRLFNRQLKAIDFDVQVIHQELLSQIEDAARRMSYADLYHKVHSYELEKLSSALTSILFTFEKADFFFLGAFDNFADYSKTDASQSTRNIINLAEKALALPYGGLNTQRVRTNHMFKHQTWPIELRLPQSSRVLAKTQVPGTSFGSIFSDIVTGWAYELVTKDQQPAAVHFKFPLAGLAKDEVEVQINRFELTPFSTTAQRALVEFSTDDINWKTPEGYEDGVLLTDQKLTYGIDFTTELAQFVRITLSKETFDEELSTQQENKQFVYRFGLKGFAAYQVGRVLKARYQSQAFDFGGQEEALSRVSVKAEMDLPEGTAADFSVALADSTGNPTSSFLPIKPIGSPAKPGASEVVRFGTTQPHRKRFEAQDADFAQREIFRGHKFYKYTVPVLPAPIFGTVSMTRGHKVWYRDKNVALSRTEVRDNHITFAKVDIEHLFATTTEVPVQRSFTTSNKPTVELTVTKAIYYTKGIHDLIPNFSQSGSDMTPTYAVYRVEHITDTPTKEHSVSTANKTKIQLPLSNFVLTGSKAPIVKSNNGGTIYVAGKDYVVETETIGGVTKPTGFMTIVPVAEGGTIYTSSTSVTLKITLTIDSDVTYKVTDVQANKITLSSMNAGFNDSFKVTYRFIPLPPNTIEKASVRVKDGISNRAGNKFFVEGTDYVLDVKTGAIQRLPNGSIPDKGSVFVDFLYRNAEENVETFLTWVFVPETLGTRLSFDLDPSTQKNALQADESVGEQFLVNTAGGLIDLTKAEHSPILGPGWVQFIVKSRNPDVNQLQSGKGNLIDQVIQLRDVNKRRIFKENGSYFSDILALRDPMTQVTLNQLRVNTLTSDHTVFAIDTTKVSEPLLVLNFKPGDTQELYLKIPRDEADTTETPLSFNEVFRMTWESKLTNENIGTSVIIRCDLSRESQVDGGITPKVYEYFLRASEF